MSARIVRTCAHEWAAPGSSYPHKCAISPGHPGDHSCYCGARYGPAPERPDGVVLLHAVAVEAVVDRYAAGLMAQGCDPCHGLPAGEFDYEAVAAVGRTLNELAAELAGQVRHAR